MKGIALTQGQVAVVDDEDFEQLSEFKWFAQWNPKSRGFYAVRNTRGPNGEHKSIGMARQIMGSPPGRLVDHEDHNTLNNRRGNLRIVTHAQNAWNRFKQTSNSTGFKGVGWRKHLGTWQARITVNGKDISLGHFGSMEEARNARAAAESRFHGNFVPLDQERVEITVSVKELSRV